MKEKTSFWGSFLPFVFGVIAAFAVISMMGTDGIFGIVNVSGDSMNPTYYDGDILRGEKVTKETKLERGDVITLSHGVETYIKRIEGLPGETLSYSNGYIYIDGARLESEFPKMNDGGILDEGPLTLGDDEYFVLGDNRNHSSDSREIGPVKRSLIKSKIVKTYFTRKRNIHDENRAQYIKKGIN